MGRGGREGAIVTVGTFSLRDAERSRAVVLIAGGRPLESAAMLSGCDACDACVNGLHWLCELVSRGSFRGLAGWG